MIYVVRHGQTDWNFARKIQGRIDTTINQTGIEQAELMREKLKNVSFTKAYTSPLLRAKATAKIIYGKEAIVDPRLTEREFGGMEGGLLMTEQFCNMWQYGGEKCLSDVESIEKIKNRLESFFKELLPYKDEGVLVVTHGGVAMVLQLMLRGAPKSLDLLEYLPKNAECVSFDLKDLKI